MPGACFTETLLHFWPMLIVPSKSSSKEVTKREIRGHPMSEEIEPVESKEETPEVTTEEHNDAQDSMKLAKKFRTITGETVLMDKRPNFFAFTGYYLVAIIMFAIHALFARDSWSDALADDTAGIVKVGVDLMNNELTFIFIMVAFTWINRLLNTSTSNRWITIWMLLASFAPVLIHLDNLLNKLIESYPDLIGDGGLLPEYDYMLAGLFFSSIFALLTLYYQRSFHYAITSDAVIFHHAFMLSRAHRRLLFDRISEIIVERSPLGVVFGFSTISILTDSGIGLVQETQGAAMGAASAGALAENQSDSSAEKAGKNIIKTLFALLTYQRTVTTVKPDPKHCFYSIRGWAEVKQLLNEKHKQHSQSTMLSSLEKAIASATGDES